MTYGEALKLVFDAHYEDLASPAKKCTRYTNEKLKCAFAAIPWAWKKDVLLEFSIISGELRDNILACPHIEIKRPYQGREECMKCHSFRNMELEDQSPHSYNDRMVWGEWRAL